MMLTKIDLHFLGSPSVIAAYLLQVEDRNILVETGPASTLPVLLSALKEKGLNPSNITDVLLTHIHFDHAGAAWFFASKGAKVYVHPKGYPHLLDPSKLLSSAKRIYKDKMDELWGEIRPITESQLIEVKDRQSLSLGGLDWIAHHTPGHAKHHIAWQLNHRLFTGDVAGVSLNGGAVVPPCPPPDINLEDWQQSIDRMRQIEPKQLLLTHFGEVHAVEEHLNHLQEELLSWAQWIKNMGINKKAAELVPDFVQWVEERLKLQGLDQEWVKRYHKANPPEMSIIGLQRYWKKKLLTED